MNKEDAIDCGSTDDVPIMAVSPSQLHKPWKWMKNSVDLVCGLAPISWLECEMSSHILYYFHDHLLGRVRWSGRQDSVSTGTWGGWEVQTTGTVCMIATFLPTSNLWHALTLLQVREIFNLHPSMNIDVTFELKVPAWSEDVGKNQLGFAWFQSPHCSIYLLKL